MKLNLTQHPATPDQVADGVIEPADKPAVSKLLTFDDPPAAGEMEARANALADIATSAGTDTAMIGGAPFFMSTLERVLKGHGIAPVHAFSRRESVEALDPKTGEVKKSQVFKHAGWVEA